MEISGHKLIADFAIIDEISKKGGSFKSGLPDTIVLHYTAGGSVLSCINTFKDNDIKASAHVVVDTDGSLTQMVPFHKIAWHAGESAWLDRNGLNSYSIGIEIVNAGRLEKSGNVWRSWFGKTYPEEEVVQAVHRNETKPSWWHRYTEEQISSVFELCSTLMKYYNIRFILGHEEISPGRKSDPGPAFPLDKIRDRLLHSDRSAEHAPDESELFRCIVSTRALNFRSGPGTNHRSITKPLSWGTELTIFGEQNGWYQAEVKMRGWVAKDFIRKK